MPIYEIDGKKPELSDSAWVAPSADIIGDVVLGEGASVWFGAVIRADNTVITIGDRSNIQENAVLHSDEGVPCSVGTDVTVGHQAMLHGCTIGDNSLIGIGAIILNHAVIGKNSIVGASALVTEGKTFPDNSLIVGSPARAIRALDEKAELMLKMSAAHYVHRSAEFSKGLKQVG